MYIGKLFRPLGVKDVMFYNKNVVQTWLFMNSLKNEIPKGRFVVLYDDMVVLSDVERDILGCIMLLVQDSFVNIKRKIWLDSETHLISLVLGFYKICIINDGPGINGEHIVSKFNEMFPDPFSRASKETKKH